MNHLAHGRATGSTYTVKRCGTFWEVTRNDMHHGAVVGRQFMAALDTEQEAEGLVRSLTVKEKASDRFAFLLED
jgi:hypothetical protein